MPNTEIREYFSKSQYNDLWVAIAENRLDDAIKEIDSHKSNDGALFGLFSKSNPVTKAASLMLSSKPLTSFSYHRLFINEDDIKEFNDLIKLLVAVHLNGYFKANEHVLLSGLLEILDYLFKDVRDGAGGYPNNPINGAVWFGGTWLRNCCGSIAYYCDLSQDLESKIKALEYKCQVTLSIMSHYPHLVGPDMVMAGEANEAAGNFPRAKQLYTAVIADLQWVADDIEDFDEEEVKSMHIYALEALAKAYERIMDIDKNDAFIVQLDRLKSMIQQIKNTA